MKTLVYLFFTSLVVLSCSKSSDLPSGIKEADEKTCSCFEPTATSFKEIREYYIENYNSWEKDKTKDGFLDLIDGAMEAEEESKDCIKKWASKEDSEWYANHYVDTLEDKSSGDEEVSKEDNKQRAEGRFVLNNVLECYETYLNIVAPMVDNGEHRTELKEYLIEEYEYEEDFMEFLGRHVGIYLSEIDFQKDEENDNRW